MFARVPPPLIPAQIMAVVTTVLSPPLLHFLYVQPRSHRRRRAPVRKQPSGSSLATVGGNSAVAPRLAPPAPLLATAATVAAVDADAAATDASVWEDDEEAASPSTPPAFDFDFAGDYSMLMRTVNLATATQGLYRRQARLQRPDDAAITSPVGGIALALNVAAARSPVG